MADQFTYELFKKVIQLLDFNYLSYVGYPPDEAAPYPEEFARGYHKCIEDILHETERLNIRNKPTASTTANAI
jgi:hypothetical protein